MEVIVLLCPSSLAHWLVGFRSGDSIVLFLCIFVFVSGFLACLFFCCFFVFILFLFFRPVYFFVLFMFFCFVFFKSIF